MDGGQILAIKLAAGTEWTSCMSSPTNPPHSFTLCSSNVMQGHMNMKVFFLIFSEGFALTDRHFFLEYKEKDAVQSLHTKLIFKRLFLSQGWVDMNTVYLSSFVAAAPLLLCFDISDFPTLTGTDERLKVVWAAIIFQLIWRRPRQTHTQSVLKTN